MKCLVTWTWKVEDINKCWERFEKFRDRELDFGEELYPSSFLVGSNKGFRVVDIDNMDNFYKLVDSYSDLIVWETHPIIDLEEAYKLRQ